MMQQKTLSSRAGAELILLATIRGGCVVANRLALNEVPVFTTVAFRVAGAGLVLWAIVAMQGLPLPRKSGVRAAFLVMGALNSAVPFTLITWGQLAVPLGLAAIVNASTAVFGVVIAALPPRALAGFALIAAGLLLIDARLLQRKDSA